MHFNFQTIRNKFQWNIIASTVIFIKTCIWKCRLQNGDHAVPALMWYPNHRLDYISPCNHNKPILFTMGQITDQVN